MISIDELYQIYLQHPSVIIDSRKVEPGCLFFALKGERFDGNQFATQAIKNGAAYAVVDDPSLQYEKNCLFVENTLEALQSLARFHRSQFETPVVAITGSNGKTTTKELVSTVLGSHYRTHFTKGNFNNHIGVPLTLLALPLDTEIAIIEMGANHIGEIQFLCEITNPTHGLITNIGKAHLEGFGGIEGVKKGKGELFDHLSKNNGLAFINLDEPFLEELSSAVPYKVYYHRNDAPHPEHLPMETSLIAETPFLKIAFLDQDRIVEVETHLIGLYNFNNLQTAVSLGKYFKVPAEKIKNAIESYVPQNNRSQIYKSESNTFILDAYNANPSSMKQALENFSGMDAPRKTAIIGDMLELGEFSFNEHTDIYKFAQGLGFDHLVLVGAEFMKSAGKEQGLICLENTESLIQWFKSQHIENQLILIKGSRGLALEKLLPELE